MVTERIPFVNPRLKKGLAAIVSDLESGDWPPARDYFVRPVLPAPVCLVVKRWVERKMEMR